MNNTAIERSGKGRQNPFTFYLSTLLYMVLALLMRAVACLPLLALYCFADSPWRWLALLCPALLVFVVLPLRFSFAQAITKPAIRRQFSIAEALGFSQYGEKLGESLLHALHLVLWGIPLGAMLAAGTYFYYQTDVITLLGGLSDLGERVTTVCAAVANFAIGIFGGTLVVPNGGLMEGLYTVGGLLAVGLLILLWGAVRNSAFRYIWAVADRVNKNPHAEARRRLRGRRWPQIGVAMLNLVLWMPTLYVVFRTLKGTLEGMSGAIFQFISTRQLSLPELSGTLMPMLFALLVCYLPLLPLRRLFTSLFATRNATHATIAMPDMSADNSSVTTSGTPEPLTPNGAHKTAQFYRMGYEQAEAQDDRRPVPAYQPAKTARPAPAEAPYQPYQPEEQEPLQHTAPLAQADEETQQPVAYRQTEPVRTAAPQAEDEPAQKHADDSEG